MVRKLYALQDRYYHRFISILFDSIWFLCGHSIWLLSAIRPASFIFFEFNSHNFRIGFIIAYLYLLTELNWNGIRSVIDLNVLHSDTSILNIMLCPWDVPVGNPQMSNIWSCPFKVRFKRNKHNVRQDFCMFVLIESGNFLLDLIMPYSSCKFRSILWKCSGVLEMCVVRGSTFRVVISLLLFCKMNVISAYDFLLHFRCCCWWIFELNITIE